MISQKGFLFVFEGPDGVGKTTIVNEIFKKLIANSFPVEELSFPGKQSGTLGKLVYEIHHKPEEFDISNIHSTSLQTLHVAAHIDAIANRIIPTLDSGKIVLLDRYWWSTFVYGKLGGVDIKVLKSLINAEICFWGNRIPTAVFLLNRKHSFKDELIAGKWDFVKKEYSELKANETGNYPIFEIFNEGSIADTSEHIINKILEAINHANTN